MFYLTTLTCQSRKPALVMQSPHRANALRKCWLISFFFLGILIYDIATLVWQNP